MIEPNHYQAADETKDYIALMREADEERNRESLAKLKEVAAAGVTKMHVRFSGSGDEGDINEIECFAEGVPMKEPALEGLRGAVYTLLDQIVTIDWWNNDGGGGYLIIDLVDFTVTSDVYYMDTITLPTEIHELNPIVS